MEEIEKRKFVLHTASEYYDMLTSFTDKTSVWDYRIYS